MVQGTINRQIMIDYLLGTIPDEDQVNLAERFSTDEELFDQLKVVEADLVDQYVNGQLGPEEARRLEAYLHHLPGGRHKIGVAQALMKIRAEKQSAPATELQPNAWWRAMFLPAGRTQLPLAYSLVAVLIVLVIGVVWLVNQNRRLHQQNERLFSQVEQHKTEIEKLKQKTAPGQEQPGEQSHQDVGSKDVEAPPNQAPADPASEVAILSLNPSRRTSSKPDTLVLDPSTKSVLLIAPTEGPETYTGYRVRIRATEAEGKIILEKETSRPPGKNIVVRVAASQLPPATYRLILELKTAASVDVYEYVFTIVKR
jgi:hypothetical protein